MEPTITRSRAASSACPTPEAGACRTAAPETATDYPSPPSRDLAPIIPEGRILAPSHTLWSEVVHYVVEGAGRRADWRRNALRLAWQLLCRSTWAMLTAPKKGATWRILADELGLSRRTIAYLISWFIDHGLLARAVPGSTPRFRKGTLAGLRDDGRGNEAAQYLLTVPAELVEPDEDAPAPPVDEEVPWPCETLLERPYPPTESDVYAGQPPVDQSCTPNPPPPAVGEETPRTAGAREPSESTSPARAWPATITPVTRKDRLAACERLINELPPLRRISARHLRSILRRAFDVGATISDIRHALDHRPDDTPWLHTHAPRRLPGWIRHRLDAWITPAGQLLAPWPVQQRAVQHTALLAEQRARREAYQRARLVGRRDSLDPEREATRRSSIDRQPS